MSTINSFRDRIVKMVADAFPELVYGSIYEYSIQPSSSAGRFDLLPVRTRKVGELPRLYQWGGPGIEASYAAGASVLVAFIDADQTRPAVVGYMPAQLPGGLPATLSIDATAINIGSGTLAAARQTDACGELCADVTGAIYYKPASGVGVWSALPIYPSPGPPPGAFPGVTIVISGGSAKVVIG